MSSGIKAEAARGKFKACLHGLENRRIPQHEHGLMTHCDKAHMVSTGDSNTSRNRFAVLMMCGHNSEEVINHKVQGPWDKSGDLC